MWSVVESRTDRDLWPVSPPAPWPASVRATLWWHRATDDARSLAISDATTIPVTMGMMIDYLDSPVGPYREVLASPVLLAPSRRLGPLPRLHVPFIAVDSETSVHGGRSHWMLPKVMAAFTGSVTSEMVANGADWSVHVIARSLPVTLPIAGALGFAQPISRAGGPVDFLRATASLAGTFRPARVDVVLTGPTLPTWLKAGTHQGITITRGRMSTGRGRRC
ncbi:hypothetical protein [Gordonia hankookensis]|uniref:Acetoacetate decarboxylase n=1 Tax=Gordonia hankookensis TaxID=589403 RepID=A0ABR7WFB5_9ACTN|nr:hypothetical protein [Gordonia hankookensis]MBD1321457.1 hypothetical protein [Gordonia hankookensis]